MILIRLWELVSGLVKIGNLAMIRQQLDGWMGVFSNSHHLLSHRQNWHPIIIMFLSDHTVPRLQTVANRCKYLIRHLTTIHVRESRLMVDSLVKIYSTTRTAWNRSICQRRRRLYLSNQRSGGRMFSNLDDHRGDYHLSFVSTNHTEKSDTNSKKTDQYWRLFGFFFFLANDDFFVFIFGYDQSISSLWPLVPLRKRLIPGRLMIPFLGICETSILFFFRHTESVSWMLLFHV